MKNSRSEVTYLILSIILIAFAAGIYLIFGNTSTNTSASQTTTATSASSSTTSEEELETKAKSLLAEAQANPSSETVNNVQAAINQISDDAKKTDLQSQLDAISTEITNEDNAKNAVATAETQQTSANVTTAQAAIDVLTNETIKSELQSRLDAVSNAMIAATQQSTTTSNNSTAGTRSSTDDDTYSDSTVTNSESYEY